METIALNKRDKFYINNQFLFEMKTVRKWLFAKEKYQIIDAFGKVRSFFFLKHRFKFSEIVFAENNLSDRYEFVQSKNDFYWLYNQCKYTIQQPSSFSYRIEFYKNGELIGESLKNSFWVSYLDIMNFSFDAVSEEEVELCLILYSIYSVYFRFGD